MATASPARAGPHGRGILQGWRDADHSCPLAPRRRLEKGAPVRGGLLV